MQRSLVVTSATFILTLATVVAASLFPEARVWGINWWGYYPLWIMAGGCVLALVLPFGVERFARLKLPSYAMWLPLAVMAPLFLLFRTETHFLGDGYLLLSLVGDLSPSVEQQTELLESWFHLGVTSLLGGGKEAALLSFRIGSIGAGILALLTVVFAAPKLFESSRRAFLMISGYATFGYALLFFGYVENYSLFVLAMTVHFFTGLRVARGQLPRWSLIATQMVCLGAHVMGVVLLPATLYVMWSGWGFSQRLPRWVPTGLVGLAVVGAVGVGWYFYNNSWFFRFALVPVVENRFTVDGYTWFSSAHLLDVINQLWLVVPSLAVLAVALGFSAEQSFWHRRDTRFILLGIACWLTALFLLDPKLGMARDWDLFSFGGVFLGAGGLYLLLRNWEKLPRPGLIVGLVIAANLFTLAPRVGSLTSVERSLAHFENYIVNDRTKNRSVGELLARFHLDRGDQAAADEVNERWRRNYPERGFMEKARELIDQLKFDDAVFFVRRALEYDPALEAAYFDLGNYFLSKNQLDSANTCFDIAIGMNPRSSTNHFGRGVALFRLDNQKEAIAALNRSLELDSTRSETYVFLIHLYYGNGDTKSGTELSLRCLEREEFHASVIGSAAGYLERVGLYDDAARGMALAFEKDQDTVKILNRAQSNPALGQALTKYIPGLTFGRPPYEEGDTP